MKKILFITAVIAAFTLTSFSRINHSINSNDMETEWVYYTAVTAWYKYDATESRTLHIWYKAGNGVRKYGCSTSSQSTPGIWDIVERNNCFRNSNCEGHVKKYQYQASNYVFNAYLPYMMKD
ncbi:MAG: hypothetical protein IJU90_01265 [Bacteroidales bacterium]|nr:hypothetical protein [Bacteroidales bacterium]